MHTQGYKTQGYQDVSFVVRIEKAAFKGSPQVGVRATVTTSPIDAMPEPLATWNGILHLEGEHARAVIDAGKGALMRIAMAVPRAGGAPYVDSIDPII